MRALVLKQPGEAAIEVVPEPVRRPVELVLKVQRVGLCGSDLNSFLGKNPLVTFPRISGHEAAASFREVIQTLEQKRFPVADYITEVVPLKQLRRCCAGGAIIRANFPKSSYVWINHEPWRPIGNADSGHNRLERRARSETRGITVPRGPDVTLSLVTTLFFLWGVPNNLNDVLIRQFMKSFAITRFEAGLVQSAFYLGYFALAMPAAMLMRRTGYKTGIVTGLILFGTGTFLFWPAAIVDRSHGFFLFALFVIASGLAFLETASNPFIAELGDPDSSERRLNFSQAFNPIGSITGVAIGTAFIFSGVELTPAQTAALKVTHQYAAYLQSETLRVVKPYIALGALAFALAAIISRVPFPSTRSSSATAGPGSGKSRLSQLLRRPFFVFSVAAQFLYVGAQVGTWSYFIQYVQDYVHEPEKTAGYFLTGSLVAFAVGRFSDRRG